MIVVLPHILSSGVNVKKNNQKTDAGRCGVRICFLVYCWFGVAKGILLVSSDTEFCALVLSLSPSFAHSKGDETAFGGAFCKAV